jgi:hypothetical protein
MTSGRAQRTTALVTAVAVLLFGLLPVLLPALYFAVLQCDETCGSNTEWNTGWHADPDAWQWRAQLVIALVGIAASGVGVRRAWGGGWAAFWPAAAIAVPSYAAWAAFVSG